MVMAVHAYPQNVKTNLFPGEGIMLDSGSVVMIPIQYQESPFSSNKMALWGGYWANLVLYDFVRDTSWSLFPESTFITKFESSPTSRYQAGVTRPMENLAGEFLFLLVKNVDRNQSGRVDDKDPVLLYCLKKTGKGLRLLSPPDEKVLGFQSFEKQGFILVKFQQDSNRDGDFDGDDHLVFLRKLDLKTLAWSNPIALELSH